MSTSIKKSATVKKSVPAKKAAPAKKATPIKKVVVHKIVSHGLKDNKKVDNVQEQEIETKLIGKVFNAISETKKLEKDIDKVTEATKQLKSIEDTNVKTMIGILLIELDNISYIIATGKSRIDNLKNKKTAQELCNSGNYGTQC